MAKVGEKQNEAFARYISEKKILIADASASARVGLAKTMFDMGAKASNITLAMNYQHAEQEMQRIKPHIVICDYDLGKRCGLDLLQAQRKLQPDTKKTLFILVTGNTSQSAVAQAAEEDIDVYILKPYTVEVLRNSIMRAALQKIQPSAYMKTIEEGKELLVAGKLDGALEKFKSAKEMDSKPSLACFYHGQTEEMRKTLEQAEGSYHEGLDYNKIHYKCLVGLFDLMMSREMHTEAYEIVKRIVRYFPANPQRLNTVLRLAIITQSYDDIERYYRIFADLDDRNEELIRYICAALVVCGKFYLKSGLSSRALELFQKAAATGLGRTRVLKEIVLALTQNHMVKHAQEFLEKFPPETRKGPEFLTCELAVIDQSATASISIDRARKLLAQGIREPAIYKILIQRSREAGLNDSAESLTAEATKLWPLFPET